MGSEQLPQTALVLALEPWLGGSHAGFLDAWRRGSMHEVRIEGLSPRHWKWRMSAGAWELGRRLGTSGARPDLLFATDYVDLAQLASFLPPDWAPIPRVLYMHENQLTYPQGGARPGAARDTPSDPCPSLPADTSWGFKNILSCLVADRVIFNSAFHRDEFGKAADQLMRTLPRPNPRTELADALARAHVVGPGVDREGIPLGPGAPAASPLRVLFNHRWEHDKDPTGFLLAIRALRQAGERVEVMALGQSFGQLDRRTEELLEELSDCIVQRGFLGDRDAYLAALGTCDVVVSTARHEFYGISVLEAICAGCTPLVPALLAYPEVLPVELHPAALYRDDSDLVRRLAAFARDPKALRHGTRRAQNRAWTGDEGTDRKAALLDRIVIDEASRAPGTG